MAFRALLAAVLCSFAGAAAAEITGELFVTTNYVWRGLSLSEDAPSVIGGLAYRSRDGSGIHASAHIAGVQLDDRHEQQLVARLGYRIPVADWRLDLGGVYYEFLRGDHYDPSTNRLQPDTANEQDFAEAYVGIGKANAEFRYSYSDDYFGSGELSRYYEFNYRHSLGGDLSLLLHAGLANSRAIDDHAFWLGDTAIGIVKEPFSFVVTNLDDNEDGRQSRNPRFVVSWRQQITL